MKSLRNVSIFAAVFAAAATHADGPAWTEPVIADYRDDAVVTYRARLAGDYLIVEATHADGWHTYAMDNVERARAKTGKETPETELPTRIRVEGGLAVEGGWRQTPPKDLSQESIKWYTWGFESTSHFVVKVTRVSGEPAVVIVDGQACNESRCRMVDRLRIEFDPATVRGEDAPELPHFVEVSTSAPAEALETE
jgi:hypothetical protein